MINYGMIKIWTNRIRANLGLLQTIMIFYLFLEKANWHWWYIPVLIIFLAFSLFDNTKGYRQEINYTARRNDILMSIHNKIMEQK
jgi:cell division protein FtsW (lipid II flippase)